MNIGQSIQIVLADDHEIFRDGFKTMLEGHPQIQLAGEAANGHELIELTKKLRPDVILTDIKMPLLSGIEATRIITRRYPFAVVIALSTFNDDHFIIDMLKAGAKGYLLKGSSKKEVLEAIYTVHGQQNYFCNLTRKRVAVINGGNPDNIASLKKISFSQREKEIIRLICKEYSTKEISKTLYIGKRTVDGYRDRIMRKINAQNIAGIVTFAIRYGIFEV